MSSNTCGRFLENVTFPLAVRSSSLLEDSQYQPFSGVYDTFMLGNHDHDIEVRLRQLTEAIKRVYASTFSQHTKAYVRATPYRLEEEKMAVLIQEVVGSAHGQRYYPEFSGVVRSRNFYPMDPQTPKDGFAAVALGMGTSRGWRREVPHLQPPLPTPSCAVFFGGRHTRELADGILGAGAHASRAS